MNNLQPKEGARPAKRLRRDSFKKQNLLQVLRSRELVGIRHVRRVGGVSIVHIVWRVCQPLSVDGAGRRADAAAVMDSAARLIPDQLAEQEMPHIEKYGKARRVLTFLLSYAV